MFDDDISFPKQRRNLLFISSLIIFFYLGNVHIGENAHIGFLALTIKNTNIIPIFISITFIYLLWRYTVTYRHITVWQDHHESIRNEMRNCAFQKADNYLTENSIEFTDLASDTTKSYDWPAPINQAERNIIKSGAIYYFDYIIKNDKGATERMPLDEEIVVDGRSLKKIKNKCLMKNIILTHLFLEYLMPFALALFAIGLSIRHYVQLLL